jgi:hypothetical protein
LVTKKNLFGKYPKYSVFIYSRYKYPGENMSFVISALQSYSNIAQQYNAESSMQNGNEARTQAIKSLDIKAIEQAGPTDSTVMALSQADKKQVLENASAGFKKKCLDTWQDSLDKQTRKQIAEDFSLGLG